MYYELELQDKCREVLKVVPTIDYESKVESHNLDASKAFCWSKFKTKTDKVSLYLEKAFKSKIILDAWHYTNAKNLRRIRRDPSDPNITKLEIDEYTKASEISKDNIVYSLFVAQTLKESRDPYALNAYENLMNKMANKDPNGPYNLIYLRIALGFMNIRSPAYTRKYYLNLAKICLEKIHERHYENSMYLHYMGIYYMKTYKFSVRLI